MKKLVFVFVFGVICSLFVSCNHTTPIPTTQDTIEIDSIEVVDSASVE